MCDSFLWLMGGAVMRKLPPSQRESPIGSGSPRKWNVTPICFFGVTYYFLEDFPSNCICSFMVWVTCPIESNSIDRWVTNQTKGTNGFRLSHLLGPAPSFLRAQQIRRNPRAAARREQASGGSSGYRRLHQRKEWSQVPVT